MAELVEFPLDVIRLVKDGLETARSMAGSNQNTVQIKFLVDFIQIRTAFMTTQDRDRYHYSLIVLLQRDFLISIDVANGVFRGCIQGQCALLQNQQTPHNRLQVRPSPPQVSQCIRLIVTVAMLLTLARRLPFIKA
jgi:hypothetical protein